MLKKYRKPIGKILFLFDILILMASFYLVYFVNYYADYFNPFYLPFNFMFLFFGNFILWVYLSRYFKIYDSKRLTPYSKEFRDVTVASTLGIGISSLPIIISAESLATIQFPFHLWFVQTGLLILFRVILRESLKYIRKRGYNYRQVLIAGKNTRSLKLEQMINESPGYGLRVLGYIDDPNDSPSAVTDFSYPLLGSLENLSSIMREKVVDEIFITLPIKSFYSQIQDIIRTAQKVGVEVKIPVDLFDTGFAQSTISHLGDVPFFEMYTSPKLNFQLFFKRMVDIVVSLLLLVILSPLFALISILIKVTSPDGSIFFTQNRVGYNGRLFKFLKFRTMIPNAESMKKDLIEKNEMDGPVFKIKDDPRVTGLGRFLRKTSLDELPQLINVLAGEMSLVGPRPPLPTEVNEYDLQYRRRLSMKPGITCLWQVNGRNNIPFEKWMELDMQYIDEWSLWLDFKIMMKTIPAVLERSGAS
ncbi:MAG: sugar transferase [Syntrophales bacterium]|jgi:exopolysaccharide biosynthesis polyprenyl glycosylphosphotransferase|nr:sugar transferase [Syntrophales bacterium]